ncbi:hypothetical protein LJC58_03845 [Lachnospiraceae bacterium OttesenSCG-928-D06]|nr:hypothetical protein [Lachnospiraceae bacterium OttesenSCG-928-D06]
MIKKCKVVQLNEKIVVIDFDGVLIQMKSPKVQCSHLYVNENNGVYFLCTEADYVRSLSKKNKNKNDNKYDSPSE